MNYIFYSTGFDGEFQEKLSNDITQGEFNYETL